jgi:hypothetical protein
MAFAMRRPSFVAGSTIDKPAAAADAIASRLIEFPTSSRCSIAFDGPIPGDLVGCSRGCVRFQTVARAQNACAELSDCGGVVDVGLADGSSTRTFELRRSATIAPARRGVDSFAFVKRCAEDKPYDVHNLLRGAREASSFDDAVSSDNHAAQSDETIKRRTIAERPAAGLIKRGQNGQNEVESAAEANAAVPRGYNGMNDAGDRDEMDNEQDEDGDTVGNSDDGLNEIHGAPNRDVADLANAENDGHGNGREENEEEVVEPEEEEEEGEGSDDSDNGDVSPKSDVTPNDDSSSSSSSDEVQFWQPPSELTDLDDIGTRGNDGEPTIFIGIASYRDMMCHETIERALFYAKRPDNLYFGVVEQNAEGDTPCLFTKQSCEAAPEQLLCKHRAQVRVMQVPARSAMGPTWGRHRADSLYRGEYFALQIDAHMYFVLDWDEDAINQFRKTGNDHAVLTNYPSDVPGSLDRHGRSLRKSTPTVCASTFVGNQRMTKHDSAQEFFPRDELNGSPVLQVWWAAGVSFSRGHRIVRVPYDCCLPMIFDGEETSMAYRMWTHGYGEDESWIVLGLYVPCAAR